MAIIIIDTNAYSGFRRGLAQFEPLFDKNNTIFVPLIVIGELRAGFASGTKQPQNEKLLQQFLDLPNVDTIGLGEATTRYYANIYTQLCRAGKPIGTNDMWIAATALEHKLPLLTLDADFNGIDGLEIIKI
ncbi:MAG: type II toxin-antitoxin system VapC family toxin [Candidatus Saccharimonadales bacterium]